RARVTDATPVVATAPTGTVSFANRGASVSPSCLAFSRALISPTTGAVSTSCAVSFTPTASGLHTITATYGGDTTHDGSSGTTGVTASKHETKTTRLTAVTRRARMPSTATATVTDTVATAPFPTGLVNFFADGAATPFT